MAAGKGGGNDLGNLFDMLNEAKKGVEAERKQTIDTEAELRERTAREAREREESRRREEAQQKLIEENRRRNEALAKRDRVEGERKALSTSPHERPVEAPKPAEPLAVAMVARKPSRLLLAALVVGGLVVGVGGAFALQPEARGAFVDVEVAARAVVAQTAKAAAAERGIQGQLDLARGKIAELEKQFGGVGDDAKKLRDELALAQKDLEAARADLQALRDAAARTPRPGGRPNGGGGGGGGGLPTIQGNVFK